MKQLWVLFTLFVYATSLREFRPFSTRSMCEMAQDANYPFAYSKYAGQLMESKGRVNSNLQDFRHECQALGGRSKCHICEEIQCSSELGHCGLQLQGVDSSLMSSNIPIISDTAWAVGGRYKHDYAGENVTHYCVFLTGGNCTNPYNTDYSKCRTRCFGYGFKESAVKHIAEQRSVVDLYPGMGRWSDDGQVDLWNFPKNCHELALHERKNCTYSGPYKKTPDFNPQGYLFTIAGSGVIGFKDGPAKKAQFNYPQGISVDDNKNVFVADTKNHAIRMVSFNGTVTTIAGRGPNFPGYQDGICKNATFSNPKGLDVRIQTINGVKTTVIIVADTSNHRIRRIDYVPSTGACRVRCLTGLCGNSTLSATDTALKATPLTGYADGSGLEARFSSPESVTFMDGDFLVVADTGNFLLRWVIASNGTTFTLAGSVIPGEKDVDGKPLAGCSPPCLQGQQGYRDGNLTFAQFYTPVIVTRGPNNTVWVVDEHRIRTVELPSVISTMYGIHSMARVSTIAGDSLQGIDDGIAQVANFYYSSGLYVEENGIAYVSDATSCHIRRITPYPLVSQGLTCSSTIIDVIRPSGCISYDPPVDKIGRKISRVEGNIQYNYGWPYEKDKDRGKYIKNCVGVPPHDKLDKHFIFTSGDNLVVDDHRTIVNEDSEQGMALLVRCPAGCTVGTGRVVQGHTWYSEYSSICLAALHDGKISASHGGILLVILEREDYLQGNASIYRHGTYQHGIRSGNMSYDVPRVFRMESYNISNNMVHSIAGHPAAPLQSVCDFADGQPATAGKFNLPGAMAARRGHPVTDTEYLYIIDTNNHRVRALSAVCTFLCENGGRCVGNDQCACPAGWSGVDCTSPVCSTVSCGVNSVCVAPNTCACKPGYGGYPECTVPLCEQHCRNGGTCTAPDTCACPPGWFDSNCTTPVCSQTCANGGNCTAPNTCACPSEWTGTDCRIPVCNQPCRNQGFCVAPNTCACPPQWSNYDCSAPVCQQGYFEAFPSTALSTLNVYFSVTFTRSPVYKNCDLQSWCNATNEFECDQSAMVYDIIRVPSGPEYRAITGRKVSPTQCMHIELPLSYKIPYQLVYSDNTTTGDLRFSPYTPYTTDPRNRWKGYLSPTDAHTGPWTYENDRQIANVNWLNVSQGRYVCANGGACVSPDICACAPGWIGFDCRTPVCDQGYHKYTQTRYVSGLESPDELSIFETYLGNNSYRLQWPYSNPNFTVQFEYYGNTNTVLRVPVPFPGKRYLAYVNFTGHGQYQPHYQGGYRCSIRANTKWEHEGYSFEHPNFYSQYMDVKRQADNHTYTYWKHMRWPPTHRKSRILDQVGFNRTYVFTNEGYRRFGVWNRTGNPWEFGICILEFARNCSGNPKKEFDLQSHRYSVMVQDTDIAYRPRITYNDHRVVSHGRWKQSTGQCIDTVIRGCANNGTCVAPGKCVCGPGWKDWDCKTPICTQTCHHNGNCTSPDICTCEKGWSGYDCSIPLCAQECQNGGQCVAPDTCQCYQFDTTFRDGRVAGGRPLFQDEDGSPLQTGWTGYDCAIPICVQAEKFVLNVAKSMSSSMSSSVSSSSLAGYVSMGGHGADTLMTCTDPTTQLTLPRCPQFDLYVTGNDGVSFQSGCGWDPYDTGCCIRGAGTAITCYKCDTGITITSNHTFYCAGKFKAMSGTTAETDKFAAFVDQSNNFHICGDYHNPRDHSVVGDYGVAKYYIDVLNPDKSSYNFRSNVTSHRFLCGVSQWMQGDYVDDAGMSKVSGIGSVYGLQKGRHVRVNTPNMVKDSVTQKFTRSQKIRGEGVYECYNAGSCIAPDTCTCTDGYEGYDCNTPLCRHLQPSGTVSGCLNGGVCIKKDDCSCVTTDSVLWIAHRDGADRGLTGWAGSDCSMPMCSQGYYDPFCTDLPQAPGGEGCYRCANGGNCTAPDVCTCAPGWTGYDCKTPVCETVADPLTRTQLATVFEYKVISFETDPCGVVAIHGLHGWKGRKYTRGNCTQPNQCTCLCKMPYNKRACRKAGRYCNGAWQDPMVSLRNLLFARGLEYTFGSTDCKFGFEGNVDKMDRFTTCHQTIYNPTTQDQQSLGLLVGFTVFGAFSIVFYRYASVRLRKKFLLAKIERRKTKRSSEESLLTAESGAFAAS